MKLGIKHLAPYLPYKLILLQEDIIDGYEEKYSEMVGLGGMGITTDLISFIEYEFIKPILRPLSDLTKEIEVNGEKFVPIDRIFKGWKTDKEMKIWWYKTELKLSCDNYNLVDFGIIQKLFEYHFDVFGLIENNLAININEL